MLVKYKGKQTAIRMMIGGLALRFAKGGQTLVSNDQASQLKKNDYVKQLVKDDQLVFDDLSGYDKSELEALALVHDIEIPAKATVKEIRTLLSGDAVTAAADDKVDLGDLDENQLSDFIKANGGEHDDKATKDDLLKAATAIQESTKG